MHTVILALGSNVGDRKHYIEKAVHEVQAYLQDIVVAPIYETKPVGYTNQGSFLNTAIKATTSLSPEALLLTMKNIEKQIGRIKRFTNGPREIDIDILFYNNAIIQLPHLVIPHPRLHERDFVLQPLSDIASEYSHPVLTKTIQELFAKLPVNERSVIRKYDTIQGI